MRKLTIGIIAHVDAGKTTLTEALLYKSGMIRKAGRVDSRDSFLDTESLERKRGVTIVSKQAVLEYPDEDLRVTIIDTPGHTDFRADAERAFSILDAAVFIINASDGIDDDTKNLFKLLDAAAVPVFIYINKVDQIKFPEEAEEDFRNRIIDPLLKDIESKMLLHGETVFLEGPENPDYETMASCDEEAMDEYFETGKLSGDTVSKLIRDRRLIPVYYGSALKMTGIDELISGIKSLGLASDEDIRDHGDEFGAICYKVSKDDKGVRLCFVKVTSGNIRVRDEIEDEKINQIRLYSGGTYKLLDKAEAGDVVAFTGLSKIFVGNGLGTDPGIIESNVKAVLTYGIILPDGLSESEFLPKLREIEDEEPLINISSSSKSDRIQISCMGEFQLEIIKNMIAERFGIDVLFDEGDVVYKETIAYPSYGIGHFEPLRHYAEVHLLLEPLPEGMGLRVGTDLSFDRLGAAFQRIVLDDLGRDRLSGVLTGSRLTDVKITLVAGKSHVKHSESYDFRHAARRAVRQALMKTESVLLEPYFSFVISLPTEYVGRVMNDIDKMSGTAILSESDEESAVLTGFAPAIYMRNYQSELTKLTAGRGKVTVSMGGYKKCHNQEEVTELYRYDPEADRNNPSGSVFTEHGAGRYIPWDEVDARAHVESRLTELLGIEEDSGMDEEDNEEGSSGRTKEERSLTERLDAIGYEEVEEILSRAHGANKHSDPLEKRRHIYKRSSSSSQTSVKGTASHSAVKLRSGIIRDKYLLIDGYNMIYAMDELKDFTSDNMMAARDKLLDIISDYQAVRGMNVIVVFDAYKVPGHCTELFDYHNVHVVYTRQAETADQYIAKFAIEKNKQYDISVASNDGMIQLIITGAGARRMSVNDLKADMEAARESISGFISE
ncbi:MAG: TetM/TetW/TetO/TetS family tetracycline resistance ribosomal protection protein [Eubacterium sp.]|nr:TetM/TetW/TetO/TetS family tetracycline resistance ribosomal protection protein [Eubacterium sp.]